MLQVGRAVFLLAVLSSALTVESCAGGAVTTLEQLWALKAAMSEVQKALSEIVGQADDTASNRIRQAKTQVDDSIKKIDDVIQHGSNEATNQREEAARQAFTAINFTQQKIDESGQQVFTHVNESLAAIASTLDAIPFVNIPDTVFTVSPYRLRQDARDREVDLYGYFPSAAKDLSSVKVFLNDKPVDVKRSAGKLYFDLSEDALSAKKTAINIRAQFPAKGWFSGKPSPLDVRLHVLRAEPYTFTEDITKDNPAAIETIAGAAYQDNTNNHSDPHHSAKDLFNLTVNNSTKYDPDSARLVNVVATSMTGGKACGGCPNPTGRIVAWNETGVDLTLNAPSCGVTLFQCNGGGSHYEITFVPTFNVNVRNVPSTIPAETRTIKAKWNSVTSSELPDRWASVIVKMSYDDNFDRRENFVVVKKATPTATAPQYDVKVENNTKLLIASR